MKGIACFLISVAILLISCNKNDVSNDPGAKFGQLFYSFGTSPVRSTFYCEDIETRNIKWETPGVFGSNNPPAIDSGIVYTCNVYGASAMKEATGEIVWNSAYSSANYANNSFNYSSYPIIKDSLLYCNGFTGSGGNPAVYCLDKKTGGIKWSVSLANAFISFIKRVPSPVIAGDYVIIAGEDWDNQNKLICLNRFSGSVNWVKDLKSLNITPAMYLVADASNIYINDRRKPNIHCFNAASGNKNWSLSLPNIVIDMERMNISGNNLIAAFDTELYVIDKNTGALNKTIQSPEGFYSVKVENSKIYASQYGGILSKFDLSGTREWTFQTPTQAVFDSLVNAQEIPITYTSQLVTAGDNVVQGFYLGTPFKCVEQVLYIIDKTNGKLLKQPKNCGPKVLFNYSCVVDGNSYYPNQGG